MYERFQWSKTIAFLGLYFSFSSSSLRPAQVKKFRIVRRNSLSNVTLLIYRRGTRSLRDENVPNKLGSHQHCREAAAIQVVHPISEIGNWKSLYKKWFALCSNFAKSRTFAREPHCALTYTLINSKRSDVAKYRISIELILDQIAAYLRLFLGWNKNWGLCRANCYTRREWNRFLCRERNRFFKSGQIQVEFSSPYI